MVKYFCEYCGIYLTHSSPGGRKQHSHGRKHINNKIEYYSQILFEFQQNKNVSNAAPVFAPQSMANIPHHLQHIPNIQKMIIPVSNIRPGGHISSG